MSGKTSNGAAVVTANGLNLPALMLPDRGTDKVEHGVDLATNEIRQRGARAAIIHQGKVDSRHGLEQHGEKVRGASRAGRGHIDLAWISFGIGDEFKHRPGRKGGIGFQDTARAPYACNWHDVVDEIEAEIVVQRRVPSVRC